MKICSKCKVEKEESEYNFKNKVKGTLQEKCKICHREYTRNHYLSNKQYYIDKAKDYNDIIRERLNNIKSYNGCIICYEREPICLDFHHLYDKVDNIATSAFTKSRQWLDDELQKCVVICSNCHRKLHAGLITISPDSSMDKNTKLRI